MANKDDDGKIGGIKGTQSTTGIQRANQVEEVQRTEKTSAVDKVAGVGQGSGRKKTMLMSAAEREALFNMIEEEAKILLKDAPEAQRDAVTESVKMAIDAGIIDDEDEKLN